MNIIKIIIASWLFFGGNLYSQDCVSLNSFHSYHGVKFGVIFPDSLADFFLREIIDDGNEVRFSLPYIATEIDTTNSKYKSWFKIKSQFTSLSFVCNKDKKVFLVYLGHSLNDDLKLFTSPKSYPDFYKNVIRELETLFGRPTVKDEKIIKKEETSYGTYWQCTTMNVSAYFSRSIGNECHFSVLISDNEMVGKHKLDAYR